MPIDWWTSLQTHFFPLPNICKSWAWILDFFLPEERRKFMTSRISSEEDGFAMNLELWFCGSYHRWKIERDTISSGRSRRRLCWRGSGVVETCYCYCWLRLNFRRLMNDSHSSILLVYWGFIASSWLLVWSSQQQVVHKWNQISEPQPVSTWMMPTNVMLICQDNEIDEATFE